MKGFTKLLKEHLHWVLAFFLAILIVIVMSFNQDSYVLQAWLGVDKKEFIEYLYLYWIIGGVIALCVFLEFEKDRKKYIRRLKEYGPWAVIAFFAFLIGNVMFSDRASCAFQVWLGTNKKETIEFFGWAIGGAIALYGFLKLEERAQAQSDANDLERFKAANEHLSECPSEEKGAMRRIASFYEFYYLARDNESYREVASDILTACLELMPKGDRSKEKQHLLNVLFGKGKNLWKLSAKDIDLQGVCLERMNLANFDLQDANLWNANLRGANLRSIDLRNADLRGADLQGADLQGANLQGADLPGVDLHGMDLQDINLQAADLQEAILTRSILTYGNLKGATLIDAKFDYAILREADLSGSSVERANFQNANLKDANMLGMNNYLKANFQKAKYNAKTKKPTEDMDLAVLEMIEDEE